MNSTAVRAEEQSANNKHMVFKVSDIFCCGYGMYFWQGIKLRYPEYCKKQKSTPEILAEMERKRAENGFCQM